MTFKIDKNVPIPGRLGRHAKYPFEQMRVGDSFEVPKSQESGMRAAASQYGKQHNVKFATRATKNGRRCWRVK